MYFDGCSCKQKMAGKKTDNEKYGMKAKNTLIYSVTLYF